MTTARPPRTARRPRLTRPRWMDQLRPLLGWTCLLLVLSLPVGLSLSLTFLLGLGLAPLAGLTLPLAAAAIWFTRRFADLHRLAFASVGVAIPRPYRPLPEPRRQRLVAVLRDPATWRDQLWLLVNCVVGFPAYLLLAALFAGFLWYVTLPLQWFLLQLGPGSRVATLALRSDYGLWPIDSQASAFTGIPLGLILLLVWARLARPVLRGYATLSAALLGPTTAALAERVRQLTETRAETIDAAAAELRRIERDLHDGAQARLVALGLSLGMAEELIRTDPEQAAALLAEARQDSGRALAELRDLVRGIHPPVLADRGLAGAVRAFAEGHPVPVEVRDALPGRPPAPVESAAYFATAEALANVAKHARADAARVELGHRDGRLLVTVSDDGLGGAMIAPGGGLDGVARRLAAFDGTVILTSPAGGPTVVTMEIPCALSSVKTTPSSGTG